MSTTATTWFIVGSQHLYGEAVLAQIAENAATVTAGLHSGTELPTPVVFKGLCTTAEEILAVCRAASADDDCIGVIAWMHTFSPAKMWIGGLQALGKPLLHLHTQFAAALPWASIDMDYMNLHQAAHGCREFGHICTRLGIPRTVVVGHWQQLDVQQQIADWQRAAIGRQAMHRIKVARFGDNMRNVSVTDGDKVAAQMQFGLRVDGFGIGDLVASMAAVAPTEVESCCQEILASYTVAEELRPGGPRHAALREEARIECGLRSFLENGGYSAFTDTFEDLHGLSQLPGLAVQRLMEQGDGFGAEGDWKTAALLRCSKIMAAGLPGGCSFMEDYTYDFGAAASVLGAHMLEVCPSIAASQPRVEIHPLGIGGKNDPVRLVFDGAAGPAVNASLIDLGDRFRLVLNAVEARLPDQQLPHLPVARALWKPLPNLAEAAKGWILAGGAHHTVYSQALRCDHFAAWAAMCGIECIGIGTD
jgi:L-arabinose isomerase